MPDRMVLFLTEIRVDQKLLKIPLSALMAALCVHISFDNLILS